LWRELPSEVTSYARRESNQRRSDFSTRGDAAVILERELTSGTKFSQIIENIFNFWLQFSVLGII
jgi:hypothetical protein